MRGTLKKMPSARCSKANSMLCACSGPVNVSEYAVAARTAPSRTAAPLRVQDDFTVLKLALPRAEKSKE